MKKRVLSLILATIMVFTFTINAFAFSDVAENHWAKEYIDTAASIGIVNGYGDGTFKPENKVTAGEFIKMVACVMDKNYTPVNQEGVHWAYQYVVLLNQIIEEFDIQRYNEASELDAVISRGDMSIILALAYAKRYAINIRYDLGDGILYVFKDSTSIPETYKPYINLCVIYKLLNGYPDNTYKVNDVLTRAQACKVICKLIYR